MFTLPTDLPSSARAALTNEPLAMSRLLDYHIVKGKLIENRLIGNMELDTGLSAAIKVTVYRNVSRPLFCSVFTRSLGESVSLAACAACQSVGWSVSQSVCLLVSESFWLPACVSVGLSVSQSVGD